MKRLLIFIVVFCLFSVGSQARTLQELIDMLRNRTAEIDTSTSSYSDSTATVWLNLAVNKIMRLGAYVERRQDYVFDRDSARYVLPSDFKYIKGVMLKSQYKAKWIPVYRNPLFGFPDTTKMQFSISWVNKDSAEMHLVFGVTGKAQYDILFHPDSLHFTLPNDFQREIAVLNRYVGTWQRPAPNPFFAVDTNVNSYYTFIDDDDTAYLYFKGDYIEEDDTIRVFYERTALDGDSIRVQYIGSPGWLDSLGDTTIYSQDLDNLVIDEALAFYEYFLKNFQVSNLIQRQNRYDMGILKGVQADETQPTQ